MLALPDELMANIRKTSPVAKVEDISDAIVFLAGPKSRWVTGATLSVNNGDGEEAMILDRTVEGGLEDVIGLSPSRERSSQSPTRGR